MPNVNNPNGLTPVRFLTGAAWNGASNIYCVPSGNTDVLAPGDMVVTTAGGDANGIPYVAKHAGTANVASRGVITAVMAPNYNNASIQGTNIDLTTQVIPGTKAKDYYVQVVDDPTVIFEILDDGVATLTATSCNKLANFTPANPSGIAQMSGTVMSTTVGTTAASFNLRIIGLSQRLNNGFGQYARWNVRINNHELAQNSVGV